MRATGERLDIQRPRVFPVDPVPDTAQPHKAAQVPRRVGSTAHP
jgi:hypothetical protein